MNLTGTSRRKSAMRRARVLFELVSSVCCPRPDDSCLLGRTASLSRIFALPGVSPNAKLPGLLFDDLRRPAVRNMVRRGVRKLSQCESPAHETRSVLDRYNIVNESDLDDAAARIQQGAVRESGHTTDISAPRAKRMHALPRIGRSVSSSFFSRLNVPGVQGRTHTVVSTTGF